MNVRSWAKRAGWQYGQHGDRPAGIIRDKNIFARRIDTQVSRARSFRADEFSN